MATKSRESEQKAELRLRMSLEDARKRLSERIRIGYNFNSDLIESEQMLHELKKEFYKWDDYNTELLRQMFTNNDPAEEYSHSISIAYIGGKTSLSDEIQDFHSDVDKKLHRLNSRSELLELIPLSEEIRERLDMRPAKAQMSNHRVFMVHGHDESAMQTVARFMEKLHLEVIILHEQTSSLTKLFCQMISEENT